MCTMSSKFPGVIRQETTAIKYAINDIFVTGDESAFSLKAEFDIRLYRNSISRIVTDMLIPAFDVKIEKPNNPSKNISNFLIVVSDICFFSLHCCFIINNS